MEADWYSYGLAHNHNFTLLTQTIVGAGYGTSIYSLPEPFSGTIGETIQLGSPEELVLEPNLVLMYEAGKDIHVQHPVDETTVSLNLLAFRPEMKQHVFDLATSKVTWAKFGEDDRILSLLELACAAATEDCKELVREIALYNPSPSVRLCAFLTLKKYGAIPEGSISELMQRDNSRLVRESTALTIDHLKAGEWTPATVGQR